MLYFYSVPLLTCPLLRSILKQCMYLKKKKKNKKIVKKVNRKKKKKKKKKEDILYHSTNGETKYFFSVVSKEHRVSTCLL